MIGRLSCVVAVILIAGCASTPPAPQNYIEAPSDFSVDMTVLDDPVRMIVDNRVREPRNQRLVLFPDGTLHYGEDTRRGAGWLPDSRRALTQAEVNRVWSLSRELNLTDPSLADPLVDFKLIKPERGMRVYLVALTGYGIRWNFIRKVPVSAAATVEIDPLLDRLEEGLAWVAADKNRPIAPKRYDFGPDPYARYRR